MKKNKASKQASTLPSWMARMLRIKDGIQGLQNALEDSEEDKEQLNSIEEKMEGQNLAHVN